MFRHSLVTTFMLSLVSTSFFTQEIQAGFFDKLANKDAVVNQKNVKDVYAGLKFNYLDREDRLLILNDFLKSVELEYALLPLKEKRIGLDFKLLKNEAIELESSISDKVLTQSDRKNTELREKFIFLQAQENMEFLDRMQALIAKFQDTHFSFQEKISRPFMYTGLRLYRADNKIVVGAIEKKFMSMTERLSMTDLSSIKVGDEIVAIDGVDVEDKITELKHFISGSTEEFIDSQAVLSLTIRNFNYERKNFIKVTFSDGRVFKLPLFANSAKDATPRLDAIAFFEKYKIPSDASTIGMNFDQVTKRWLDSNLSFSGYSVRNLATHLKGVTEWKAEDGSVALKTGYFINKGRSYAVMQLMTFSARVLKSDTGTLPYLEAIRNFLIETKQNEVPLIFDLRVNNGGNGSFPAAILSMLLKENSFAGGPSRGFRMTQYMRNLQEPYLFQEIVAEDQTYGVTIDDLEDMIQTALNEKREFVPMFNTGAVVTDAKVKGFNQDVVALVTADCISACDMMVSLLKSSGRAKIIGTHTNGTGAGFLSTAELNTRWEDRLRVLSTQIPNFLFGNPGEDLMASVFDENSVDELCLENMPTHADIPYRTTKFDVVNNNLGWLLSAAEVLKK